MKMISHGKYDIELIDDPQYDIDSSDNVNSYDFAYVDKEDSRHYRMIQHGIRIYQDGSLYKSAIVCSSGGATGIHDKGMLIDEKSVLICCAKSSFKLSLPDLKLLWVCVVDMITCFGVYKVNDAIFTHGEVEVTRLDQSGNIIWQSGFKDILVNIDTDEPCFVLHQDRINILDFARNRYELDFDGKCVKE